MSQTPLGERVPSAKKKGAEVDATEWRSQTPLGERVPSANLALLGKIVEIWVSQTPLGERVPSAHLVAVFSWWAFKKSQTPLGERVPSACRRPRLTRPTLRLKPLSGNVCLRPEGAEAAVEWRRPVSNPSRGTCAFGLSF